VISVLAYGFIAFAYSAVLLVAGLARIVRQRRWRRTGRILVTGTFHNPNWYVSHISPLAQCGIGEVIVVADRPEDPMPGVRFACPPRWLAKVVSRAVAKLIWLVITGLRCRPDAYMGYHIVPAGCAALVAGRLLGRPACYQMTGGPIEILGGGIHSDCWCRGRLGHPSAYLEALAARVIGQMDLVVVRGAAAKAFLAGHGVNGTVSIITGSVRPCEAKTSVRRDEDLVFLGRLAPIKQPEQFVDVVAAVADARPSVRGVVVGDGPRRQAMRARAAELGVSDRLRFMGRRKDVEGVLQRCRVFVLTSRSEGLSIAMAEAMANGAVPVVPDVGELDELVRDGVNGYLVEPNNVREYAARVTSLLRDPDLWQRCSLAAMKAAREKCSVAVISAQWQNALQDVLERGGAQRLGPQD